MIQLTMARNNASEGITRILPSQRPIVVTKLNRSCKQSNLALPVALTVLLLLYPVAVLPLLQFDVGGTSREFTLLGGLTSLKTDGLYPVAVLLGWCTLGANLWKNLSIVVLTVGKNVSRPWKVKLLRSIDRATTWETQEVLALGAVICALNLSGIGSPIVSIGFYFLLILFLVSMWASSLFSREMDREKQSPAMVSASSAVPMSLSPVWALVVTGFILYIPANIFPLASFTFNGVTEERTIMGGVSELGEQGKPLLAMIVFLASVAIPLLKLAGLAVLLVSVQNTWKRGQVVRQKMFTFIRIVGRWALLDIFIIMLLISLVDFGIIAAVKPAAVGVYFFCALIIVTLLAAESFDAKQLESHKTKY